MSSSLAILWIAEHQHSSAECTTIYKLVHVLFYVGVYAHAKKQTC